MSSERSFDFPSFLLKVKGRGSTSWAKKSKWRGFSGTAKVKGGGFKIGRLKGMKGVGFEITPFDFYWPSIRALSI